MQQKFKAFLKEKPQLKKAKILLAISGGVDSMALWNLMEQAKLNVHLAHVNFQLRGIESDNDQAFLEKEADKRKVKLHLLSTNTSKIAKTNGQSTQLAAREIRYAWFEELMEKFDYDYLLTAHHLDDSIETFFINLNRGTGLKGLTGIQSKKHIIRPLLNCSKKEIYAFAKEQKVPFREDASNADSNYLRNWFRNEILPLWKAKNPAFEATMQANMQRLQESQLAIENAIESDLRGISDSPSKISFQQIGKMQLPKVSLMHVLEPIGFNYSQVNQLLHAVDQKESGGQFFSESHSITVDRQAIFIAEQEEDFGEILIEKDTKSIAYPLVMKLDFIEVHQVDFKSTQTEYLDADKLHFPLKLRIWKEGDKIKPLGMKGKKLVSDLLIDNKVPQHLKQKTLVLLSGKQLVAVIGLQISDDFKIHEKTQKVWEINWLK